MPDERGTRLHLFPIGMPPLRERTLIGMSRGQLHCRRKRAVGAKVVTAPQA